MKSHVMKSHVLLTLTIAGSLTAFAAEQQQYETQRQEDRALAQLGRVDPALVVAWNQTVNDIAFAEDQFLTFKGDSRPRHDAHRDA